MFETTNKLVAPQCSMFLGDMDNLRAKRATSVVLKLMLHRLQCLLGRAELNVYLKSRSYSKRQPIKVLLIAIHDN